jgi:hypothetical protein
LNDLTKVWPGFSTLGDFSGIENTKETFKHPNGFFSD